MQLLASIDQQIAQIAERKRLIKTHLGADNCWSDRDFVALDAEYSRLLVHRREIDSRPPSRFVRSYQDGYETLWMKDVPQARKIHGIASSSTVNSHKYALLARGMKARLPVPLLSSHKGHRTPIGEVFHIRKSSAEIYVIARLFENETADHAWKLIELGETRCFSGAGCDMRLQGISNGISFYDQWTLSEVSVCPKGANPDCRFDIFSRGAL